MGKQEKLNKIEKTILNNLKCPLKDAALNLVFGKGNPNAKILFIGEAPGAKEDEQGLPFVGRAGKELDKLLHKIELTIDDVYIANILKYRPPKNRDPTKVEIKNHTPYLIEQIITIKPKIIVTLGNFATKFVLSNYNIDEMKKVKGIAEIHGTKHTIEFNKEEYLVIPIYHPSAMMYKPSIREHFQNDFKIMSEIIGTKYIEEEKQKSLNDF